MLGTYDRTPIRRKTILDGLWDFVLDQEEVGEEEQYFVDFPTADLFRITVPGVWESETWLERYQGVAWYARNFVPEFAGLALITFGAVAYNARVWLNGEFLGSHEGDFTAFQFLCRLQEGPNRLVVRVDNRHSDDSLPKAVVDWYPYGGITRSVVVEEISGPYIEYVHLLTSLEGEVKARAHVVNPTDKAVSVPFTLHLMDGSEEERTVRLRAGERKVETITGHIPNPNLWSPEEPFLYSAMIRLGNDVYVQRFGFRQISTDGHRLLLNGKQIWLRGVNRHEDHPDWGFALPEKIMQRDVDIILSLYCNAVRGSHYPNHPFFLDLCDEQGLLFFAEVPGWQYSAHQLSHSPTKDKLGQMLTEMITQQFNHPSIIIWSLHNECETDVYREPDLDVRGAMEELFALVRSLDSSRLVTYASNHFWHDKHFDLADVVCLNEYIGWYVDDIEGAEFPEYLERMAEMVPDKPILITEFGAGALSGYHSLATRKWSEEYQAAHLTAQIGHMRENEHVAGCFVWQYCDTLSNPERAVRRPREMNNKGILDEYRRPKLAYMTISTTYDVIASEDE